MQDIHSIGGGGGGGGRLFGGGGGGDRRLRPHNHHHHHQGHGPQALKCPRCESLNTKFCYYNNYNLSQPRHFCKNCRRYWTKGGVLRNVPVGGGCRKTKRSKPKSSTSNNSNSNNRSSETTALRKSSTNSQNSSSESSSLTATTTAANTTATTTATVTATAATAPATAAAEVLSAPPTMINFQESSTGFLNPNPSFDPTLLDQSSTENNNIFPEIGTFTSLIASSNAQLPLGFNTSPFSHHHHHQWMQTDHTIGGELKIPETTDDGGGVLGTEDWNNGATDQALFDLTGTVDQSYWNQTQWDDDHDHHGSHQLNYHLP